MSDGPYLFDVGLVALAHAGTPVSDRALSYVRDAISGEIDAIVPYPALIGAHHILTSVYGFSNDDASALMRRFTDARRIHWVGDVGEQLAREGFDIAAEENIDGWDGYYAAVARAEGAATILTIDDDFDDLDGIDAEVVLSPSEFATLDDYVSSL